MTEVKDTVDWYALVPHRAGEDYVSQIEDPSSQ
jgi:hypothetical protein